MTIWIDEPHHLRPRRGRPRHDGTMTPTDVVRATVPLSGVLGLTASEVSPDRVVVHLDWSSDLCGTGGLIHGGVLTAAAEAAAGTCATLNLPECTVGTSKIEITTCLIGTIGDGASLTVTAEPVRSDRSTIVVEAALRTGDGRLLGTTTRTQSVTVLP